MRRTKSEKEGDEFFKRFRQFPKKLKKIGRKQQRERKRITRQYGENNILAIPEILNVTRNNMARAYNQTGKVLSATKIPVVEQLGDFSRLAAETSLTNGQNIVTDPAKIGRLLSAGLAK